MRPHIICFAKINMATRPSQHRRASSGDVNLKLDQIEDRVKDISSLRRWQHLHQRRIPQPTARHIRNIHIPIGFHHDRRTVSDGKAQTSLQPKCKFREYALERIARDLHSRSRKGTEEERSHRKEPLGRSSLVLW